MSTQPTWLRERVLPVAIGDWEFELRDDEVSRIRFRGADVLRGVRAVARDRNWATPQWTIVGVDETAEGIRLELRTTQLGADLDAELTASVRASTLEVAFAATSRVDFLTNRTGLVMLHPPQLAGTALEVTRSDGSVESTRFPSDISPHQPAFDIAGLGWRRDGLEVRCDLDGDVFEMEDQRNWTDASFKTYSRPLAREFPYRLAAGETVRQRITITAESAAPATSSAHLPAQGAAEPLTFTPSGAMPAVSTGAATAPGEGPAPSPTGSDVLVELDLGWSGWPRALERAAGSGLPVDVRFVLPEAGDRDALHAAVRALRDHDVARVTAFQPAGHAAQHVSDAAAIALLRDALVEAGVDAPVVGGARSHFTELNREHHRLPADLDGIVFSTTPLFHTLETLQLEESVAMQRLVAEQAVRIGGGIPVHVGPITLRAHVNNVATTTPARPRGDDLTQGYGPELLDADDERQTAHELAAWLIASAAALCVPGVATLSFFEEWGPRGIRTAAGSDLPTAAALRELAALGGRPIETAHTADGRVWALRAGESTLVANLSDHERTVSLDSARSTPLVLPPYAWRRV